MKLPEIVPGLKFIISRNNKTINHNLPTTSPRPSGFTLIELLVVISIIGILAAIAAASYTKAQEKGRDAKRKADLKAVQQALELYYQTNGLYPNTFNGAIRCSLPGDASPHQWGTRFFCFNATETITYMNTLPKDPSSSTQYYYEPTTPYPFTSYRISSVLENTSDQEYCATGNDCITPGTLPCQPTGTRQYCVINP